MKTNGNMKRTTLFWVFLLNLVCIINSSAQETEYNQYEKTTTIQNKEVHQIVAEYDGKYYYCVDKSQLGSNHYFDAVGIDKEDDNLLQLPTNNTNGVNIIQYSTNYRIRSHNTEKYYTFDTQNRLIDSQSQDSKGLWTISFQPDGKVRIFRHTTSKDYTIVFNIKLQRFVITTDINNNNYTLPYIFKKQPKLVTNVTISNTLWTTFYSDYCVNIPNGVEVYNIENIDENGLIKKTGHVASESNIVNLREKTPVLLHSKQPGTYPLYESTDLYPLIFSNYKLLRGTSTDQMIEAEDGYSYYMLTYGTIDNERIFGFFYGAENGGPFVNKGGKAYLAVPTTIANQAIGFALEPDNITSIENGNYVQKSKAQYITTLSGIRINHTDKSKLPSGIYIIDGKKAIIK